MSPNDTALRAATPTMAPAAGPPVVTVQDLVVSYGPTRALEGVDLTIGAGRVHGAHPRCPIAGRSAPRP